MDKISITQAIEMAKKDPNTQFATSLRQAIESGKLDEAAQIQGVDLSVFGRPKSPAVRMEEGLPIKEPTGAGRVIRGILKTPAQVTETFKAIGDVAFGNKTPEEAIEGSYSPYLGQIQPIGMRGTQERMEREKTEGQLPLKEDIKLAAKDFTGAAGAGVELASYMPIARIPKTLGSIASSSARSSGLSQAISQLKSGAKVGAIEGGAGTSLYELGTQMQEGEVRPLSVIGSGILGTAGGGLFGGLMSVGGSVVGQTSRGLVGQVNKIRSSMNPKDATTAIDNLASAYQTSFVGDSPIVINKLEGIARKATGKTGEVFDEQRLIRELAEEGYVPQVDGKLGRMKTTLDDLDLRRATIAEEIDPILESYSDVRVPLSNLYERAKQNIIDSPQIIGDTNKALRELDTIFASIQTKYGDDVNPLQINEIRKNMNRKTKAFNTDLFELDTKNAIGGATREALDEIVPDNLVREANEEIARLYRISDTASVFDKRTINVGEYERALGRFLGTAGGAGLVGGAVTGSGGLVVAGILATLGANMMSKFVRNSRFNEATRKAILEAIGTNPAIKSKIQETASKANAQYLIRQAENYLKQTPQLPEKSSAKFDAGVINLPTRSQSAIDAEEIARIQSQRN